jgi:hypothetical protein
VTTAAQDRYIRLHHLRETQQLVYCIDHTWSAQSLRPHSQKPLRDAGVRARHPVRAVVLNQQHRQNRLQWAQTHRV